MHLGQLRLANLELVLVDVVVLRQGFQFRV